MSVGAAEEGRRQEAWSRRRAAARPILRRHRRMGRQAPSLAADGVPPAHAVEGQYVKARGREVVAVVDEIPVVPEGSVAAPEAMAGLVALAGLGGEGAGWGQG